MTILQKKDQIRHKVGQMIGEKAIGTYSIQIYHLLKCIQKTDTKTVWRIEYKIEPKTKQDVYTLTNRVEKLILRPSGCLVSANEKTIDKIIKLLNITE